MRLLEASVIPVVYAIETKSSHHQVEAVDLKTLKKLVLSFERRLRDNIAARLKYVENPEKFADSEVDLHDELQKLKILAGAPELYPELVASNTVPSIVNLLSHENADIANDVVQLLQDLTDEDALEDNDEPARVLVDALVENNVLELLVQNMNRLSEGDPDEAAAIYATLTVIENLVEVKPSVAEMVCERTKLLRWLVLKIKVRDFEGIKQYASEILAILLQNSTANQKRLGQMNGVDAVLEGVAMYKSRDPKTPDEEEMLENLFDVLCCLLMPLENKERFVNAEGVELMIIIMKQKKYAYGSAIRALDFAMTNYPPACERFVDVMGLKTAFAAFMAGILRGSRRDRLLSKFVENEYEKIDRLMELYIRYSDRVRSEAERLDQLELDDLELDEDEKYNRKLESGLYSLQLVAVILGHIWCSEHSGMRARIELLLKQQKLSKNDVKEILQEYHDNLGDVEGAEEKERGQARIQLFISAFLLEELEKSSHHQVEAVDLKTLKKLVLSFERRLRDNIAARLKYVENPEKFADSEVDLHDELQKLKILAGAPELYPELVASNTVPSIVNLLSHENADIANDVVQLLQDLTDEDALEDNDEPARVLVDALVENNVLELLVQNMNRLSEGDPDEAAAIYATLTVIENLVEVKPSVAEMVCERTKLLRWLVLKIKVRDFEGIKQYASEILAILLQNSTANQKRLGQMNGVDAVLEGVAMYKSRDPKTPDEEEMLENLFDVLCCLLMPLENKERFVNAEGVELMIIIMKQKKYAYGSAIRALDFAMTNYPPACERFVDVMGLKTAFAAFMGKASLSLSIPFLIPLNKRIKRERYKEELEERVISLVASLFAGILRGSRRDRLLSKFVENEYEKIDRLMELYIRYSDRVRSEAERLDQLELDDLELDEDEKYNRKLESGLYSLQLVAVILGHIWCSEHSGMRARIELLLKQQKLSKNDVKEILQVLHSVTLK
ncbi:hypothetical protein F2Q68_00033288 [Brassica cretica]|uniref:Beta-catenin-like protein 1 N-terminal domain-containing protein n=1 Tax=Brassica cretica TaxID=69181 RepID=A0A8S9GG01_BRACR|nr:hypothetical protein F2Q68_00033288 [Brassica cretica]